MVDKLNADIKRIPLCIERRDSKLALGVESEKHEHTDTHITGICDEDIIFSSSHTCSTHKKNIPPKHRLSLFLSTRKRLPAPRAYRYSVPSSRVCVNSLTVKARTI